MTANTSFLPHYRRLLRRETHAARTGWATVAAVLVGVIALVAFVVSIWVLLEPGLDRRLAAAVGSWVSGDATPRVALAAGAGIALVALVFVVLACVPGRRPRQRRVAPRTAILIDDQVLANATADAVARDSGVPRDRITVDVQRGRVRVRVTPTSGVPLAETTVREAAATVWEAAGVPASVRVTIAARGVVA